MGPARRSVLAAGVTVVMLLATACSDATTPHPRSLASLPNNPISPTVGAPGVGDPYFPLEGNGGYDVGHYDLKLSYTPTGHHLAGTTTVTATATQDLTRFDLELFGMTVSTAAVNGAPAT